MTVDVCLQADVEDNAAFVRMIAGVVRHLKITGCVIAQIFRMVQDEVRIHVDIAAILSLLAESIICCKQKRCILG